MKYILRIPITLYLLALLGCAGSVPSKTTKDDYGKVIREAISFKIEGPDLVEFVEYMAASGAAGANRNDLANYLGVNLSTILIVCDQEEVQDKGIEFYLPDEPRETMKADDGNQYVEVKPWEMYASGRLFAGKSLVDRNHIKNVSVESDGLIRCEFRVPNFAKGTFYVNIDKKAGKRSGDQIFLRKEAESGFEYVSFNDLLKP